MNVPGRSGDEILLMFFLPKHKKSFFAPKTTTTTTAMASAVGLLPINLQNTLYQIIENVNNCNGGIRVMMLSTAEGVPLGRVYGDRVNPMNEDVLASIESTWAPASKQFPLLNMGKEARTVTAIYDHGELVIVVVVMNEGKKCTYIVNLF